MRAFWERVRQGFVILKDRRRYFREVFAFQFAGWLFRFAAFWCLLEAFGVGGSVRNVLLVLGVNAVAALVPVHARRRGRPAGAAGEGLRRHVACVAAYSVGQQIAIGAFSLAVGFVALFFDLPLPLLQGGDRGGQGGARGGEGYAR